MQKIFFLISVITGLTSCNEKVAVDKKIVEDIAFKGWFNYSTINFTDGSFIQRGPGWINDLRLEKGDTLPVSVFLTREDWPDTLFLRPVNREDILDSDTKELLCTIVTYEDNLGLMIRKRNYKTIRQIPSEIKLCQGGFEYYECGKE